LSATVFDIDEQRLSWSREWRKPASFCYLGSIYGKAFYMPLFIYCCPTTGYQVQGFSAEDVSVNTHTYEPVVCAMCKSTHHVNPATGVVLSEEQAMSRSKPPARST